MVVATLTLAAGCTSHTKLTKTDRQQVHKLHHRRTFWLQQSLYAGSFYDDKRYRLAHPHAFSQVDALKTPDGYTILPPVHDSVIPAGTRVQVTHIRWPTGKNIFTAPLYTPKKCAWVYLKVALDRGPVTLWHSALSIVLVPDHVTTLQGFRRWFGTLCSTHDPNRWLDSLPKAIRQGIEHKHPVVGMNTRQLHMALGKPQRSSAPSQGKQHSAQQTHVYGQWIVMMQSDKVVQVQPVPHVSSQASKQL